MKILIGFVNQFFTKQLNLGALDTENEKFYWITNKEIIDNTKDVRGVNGILRFKDFYIVGYQSNPTKIIIFDKEFSIINVIKRPEIKNLHSFCFHDNKLLCVSTGTDEIYELTLDENMNLIKTNIWYQMQKKYKKEDTYHINSIASSEGDVYLTCFGEKYEGSWGKSKNGKIVNVLKNNTIMDGLYHPHTIYFYDNKWIVCESGTGNILFENLQKLHLGGYVRGITNGNNNFYVATSGKRILSRSKGTMNAVAKINYNETLNYNETFSFVHIIAKKTFKPIMKINLGLFGTEIFDLAIINEENLPGWVLKNDAVSTQIFYLKKELIYLNTLVKEKTLKKLLTKKIRNIICNKG